MSSPSCVSHDDSTTKFACGEWSCYAVKFRLPPKWSLRRPRRKWIVVWGELNFTFAEQKLHQKGEYHERFRTAYKSESTCFTYNLRLRWSGYSQRQRCSRTSNCKKCNLYLFAFVIVCNVKLIPWSAVRYVDNEEKEGMYIRVKSKEVSTSFIGRLIIGILGYHFCYSFTKTQLSQAERATVLSYCIGQPSCQTPDDDLSWDIFKLWPRPKVSCVWRDKATWYNALQRSLEPSLVREGGPR